MHSYLTAQLPLSPPLLILAPDSRTLVQTPLFSIKKAIFAAIFEVATTPSN
jgi:hypothetical protein